MLSISRSVSPFPWRGGNPQHGSSLLNLQWTVEWCGDVSLSISQGSLGRGADSLESQQ